MIAVGIGCRKACPAGDIVALVETAVARLPPGTSVGGLFSVETKAAEPGLMRAAEMLQLPLTLLGTEALQRVAGQTTSCSRRVEEMFGVPGIAETTALAGAGQGAVLLVPRMASASATCAIAGPA